MKINSNREWKSDPLDASGDVTKWMINIVLSQSDFGTNGDMYSKHTRDKRILYYPFLFLLFWESLSWNPLFLSPAPLPMSTASRKLVRRIQSGNFMEILFPSPWVSGWGVVVIWLCAGHLMIVFIIKPQIQTPGRPRAKTGCCLESSEQQSIMCHFVPALSDLGNRVLSANCY